MLTSPSYRRSGEPANGSATVSGGFSGRGGGDGSGGPWFGVRFSDGRTASYRDLRPVAVRRVLDPACPLLEPIGRFGADPDVDLDRWWVWPLPPPGRLEITVDWPTRGIAAVAVIDAEPILDAAARAIPLWPSD